MSIKLYSHSTMRVANETEAKTSLALKIGHATVHESSSPHNHPSGCTDRVSRPLWVIYRESRVDNGQSPHSTQQSSWRHGGSAVCFLGAQARLVPARVK
ncbi:hypothetical protein CCM_06961 [Cordyceps militaris CM01]|uniref:Uncharacterized protein n=1 Tax=Cordyceps militaris (strain CM01) TaxID=983644 RepID=G3JLG7_CORMM|nr:uncharacterized protein CCM_06961 [Cordyceps militaris CM01]EGX90541.1 hypothetical protein CCM_06961 [Cordyceps militaris CM01]